MDDFTMKRTKLRGVIEMLNPNLSTEEVTEFVNRYLTGQRMRGLDDGAITQPRPPMSFGINEDVAADMMRRMELNKDKGRADGGRIGFREGRQVKPVEIPAAPSELEVYTDYFEKQGLSRQDAEKAAEQFLYGPDSAMLNDSKKGLGELMRTARMADDDEDDYKSPPFIDDPEGRMETDPFEMIKEALEKGRISELSDSDAYAIYDAAVERGTFDGTFEEFKAMLSQLQQQQRRPEGIMQTMVT